MEDASPVALQQSELSEGNAAISSLIDVSCSDRSGGARALMWAVLGCVGLCRLWCVKGSVCIPRIQIPTDWLYDHL